MSDKEQAAADIGCRAYLAGFTKDSCQFTDKDLRDAWLFGFELEESYWENIV